MGANWFRTYSMGKDIKEAYNNAVNDANEYHGHQEGYSGEINSSAGFRDVTKDYKSSKLSLEDYMSRECDKMTKHDGAHGICVQEPVLNKNKIKSTVEHIVTPGTKKWVLKYVLYDTNGDVLSKGKNYFDKKGEAVNYARQYTEATQNKVIIQMEKVLESGSPIVAKTTYKRSNNEKDGKWLFFGWAAY